MSVPSDDQKQPAPQEPPPMSAKRIVLNWLLAAAGLGGIFLLGNLL